MMISQLVNHYWAMLLLQALWSYEHVRAHGNISRHRHLLLEDISMVVMLGQAEQTPGPFAEEDDDYVRDTNDLTLAGIAGSPGGLIQDRRTVTDGIPISVTMNVFDVSTPGVGIELPNVEVFLWHTDAKGVYSAVADERNGEITIGQMWCRGIQLTNEDGKATFDTILPGWYPGRAIHYHVRLRYPGAIDFAATSQLYISDDDLSSYETVPPYSFNPAPTTPLQRDSIFAALEDPTIQDLLTLKMNGSVDTGYTASVNVGLVAPPGMVGIGSYNPTPTTITPTTSVPLVLTTTDEPTASTFTTNYPTTVPTAPPAEFVPVARPTFGFQEDQPPSLPPSAAGDDLPVDDSTTETLPPTPPPGGEEEENAGAGTSAEKENLEEEDIAMTDENAAASAAPASQHFCYTITTSISSLLFLNWLSLAVTSNLLHL